MTTEAHSQQVPKMAESTRSEDRRSSAWIWAVVVLVLAGAAVAAYFRFRPHSETPPAGKPPARPMPVVVAKTRKGDLNLYLTGLGTVTALNTVTLRSRVDGQIDKVAFTEGQLVHEGDLLFEIDPRPFQVQLAQAEAQLAKDQALLKNARLDLDRFEQAKDAVPAQQLATQSSTVRQYEAVIQADQAQVNTAKLQLVYCHIVSPITGRIGLRLVDSGNMVRANDATGLAVVTQTQPISVVFTLPEDSIRRVLPKIRAGEPLSVDAYDRDLTNRLATGKLLALDNQVDTNTGTVKLKAAFSNDGEILYPNQFVNARLLAETRKGVVVAPTAALQRSPQSTFVYVVKLDEAKSKDSKIAGAVEIRNVTPGPSEGNETIIEKGLEPDETVVTDGVDKLTPGARVTIPPARSGRGKEVP